MIFYQELQKKIFEAKNNKGANVTDAGREIIILTEKFGWLCDAVLQNSKRKSIILLGELMVELLGFSAMFRWEADKIINIDAPKPSSPAYLEDYLSYLGKEIGLLSGTYLKSNKLEIKNIDRQYDFMRQIGNLMGYCHELFKIMKIDEWEILVEISNEKI